MRKMILAEGEITTDACPQNASRGVEVSVEFDFNTIGSGVHDIELVFDARMLRHRITMSEADALMLADALAFYATLIERTTEELEAMYPDGYPTN
jgi:hypothetical protein